MYHRILRFFQKIRRFWIYGYVGATKCHVWDYSGIYDLISLHLDEMYKFMCSDKTHLQWNNNKDTNLMRKLAELRRLSKFMCGEGTGCVMEVFDKYAHITGIQRLNSNDPDYKRDLHKAIRKDRIIREERHERFWYLFKKYLHHFWD